MGEGEGGGERETIVGYSFRSEVNREQQKLWTSFRVRHSMHPSLLR